MAATRSGAKIGAEAIREMLAARPRIEAAQLREDLKEATGETKPRRSSSV
jgi:DNA-directed RNA polymerase subunit beta'